MSESNRNEWTEQEKQEWRERGGIGVPPWESKWRDFKPLAQRWLAQDRNDGRSW